MTGMHAVHVAAGLVWHGLLLRAGPERRGQSILLNTGSAGLYWHSVTAAWVMLFALFHLV